MVSDTDIIEAAITVFANKPGATMADVAKEAGVTRLTVNRKFGAKKDLIHIATTYCLDRFEDVLEEADRQGKSPLEKVYRVFRGYSLLKNHYFFWMRIYVDDRSRYHRVFLKQLEMFERLVVAAQQSGDLRADLPSGWIAGMFDYIAITANTSLNRGVVAERDIYKVSWDTLMNGVSPKKLF